MHFSEEQLREALRRKDPGEGFTQKVMAHVAQQQRPRAALQSSAGGRWVGFWRRMRLRPVLVGTIVALLALGGSLGVVKHRQAQEARAGEAAKRRALLALQITNAKLNHVFERAKNAQSE